MAGILGSLLFSGNGNGNGGGTGDLGLEVPIQQSSHQFQHHPQTVSYTGYSAAAAAKSSSSSKQVAVSDDEEADEGGNGKRKMSQWQRMKWTDTMVRLLIMAVFYIGDECGGDGGGGGTDPSTASKKKAVGGGLLQKKGKWKSVSRAMMEKGFYVSPQQCEDKFNDLNKRYKRVNDILGKGTACKVVENQSLMDSMALAPKLKDEVRKLLNSKHLFFREMCAYHNTCAHPSPDPHPNPNPPPPPPPSSSNQLKQKHGFDMVPEVEEEEEDEDEEDDIANYSDDDEHEGEGEEESEGEDDLERRKRGKKGGVERLSSEVVGVVGDGGKSWWEKREWLKERAVRLEEQGVGLQLEALELEKQRLKWVKFSSKKEREMEMAKFHNQKRTLDNHRMLLLLRQKELQVLDQRRPAAAADPSSLTG